MSGQMLAGTARIDITPDWSVMLAGFGQRTVPCTGIHDRIHAKALYLAHAEARLLIVTTDLLCIPAPLAGAVKADLGQRFGLARHQVCLCASHTHSAPVPAYASDGAEGIERYGRFLYQALTHVAATAIGHTRPARLRSGVGHVDLFMNRRTRGNPNHVDRRVAVLAVDTAESGEPLAVLFGVGCHPVTIGWDHNEISADFPGVAQRCIEDALPGANALFFNTTEGNVIPVTSPNLDALDPRGYCGGGFSNSRLIGEAIAAEVLRVDRTTTPSAGASIASGLIELQIQPNHAALDATEIATRMATATKTLQEFLGADVAHSVAPTRLWSVASQHVIDAALGEDDMRRLMIACCHVLGLARRGDRVGPPRPVTVPVLVMRIDALVLLALPGEVLVEVGDEWSRLTGSDNAFIVGLANGHLRYLPRAAHFAEPFAELRYETVTAGLEANGIERALTAAAQLYARLSQ